MTIEMHASLTHVMVYVIASGILGYSLFYMPVQIAIAIYDEVKSSGSWVMKRVGSKTGIIAIRIN